MPHAVAFQYDHTLGKPSHFPFQIHPIDMDIQFSDRVVQVLKHSQEEAHRLHSTVVRPEHILLGIIKDGAGVAIDTLTRAGVDLAGLKYKLEGYLTRPDQLETDETQIPIIEPGFPQEDSIVIDKAGDRTLKFSKLEARMLHSRLTDSEHILLAMLKDGNGCNQKVTPLTMK